jgi:membrane protease subunit HflK
MIVAFVVLVVVGINSYYTVDPQETAVIQRFGRYIGTADAGLHFKIPFGVDTVSKIVTGQVLNSEYGYRTQKADVRSQFVQWVVQYQINDPVDYLFKVSGVEATLNDISESVMRRIVGNRYSDEVITVGRESVADQCRKEIQEIMDLYQTGLKIVAVKLQTVSVPNPVLASFNEVSEAQQEKDRMINEAQRAYNEKIPRAVGEARQTVTQAEGYALERVNRSEGEAKRFLDILAEYRKAPDVTRRRMYLDSFEALMGRIDHLYVFDEGQKNILPLLDLNKFKGQSEKAQSSQAPPRGQ